MRRSCHFCRSRKIRCSGQSKCDACRERSIDCVYGTEALKGRPRGSGSSKSANAVGRGLQVDRPAVDMAEHEVELLDGSTISPALTNTAQVSSDPSLIRTLARTGSVDARIQTSPSSSVRGPAGGTVAAELEVIYRQNFYGERTAEVMSPCQEVISAFQSRLNHGGHGYELGPAADSTSRQVIMYEGCLPQLTQELVEMLSVKFGRLGCHHLGDFNGRFYVRSLEVDTSQSMFAGGPPEGNPLNSFDDYRTLQLIDIWFSVHPLSTVVSKTMLLREYRSNTHDEILLAVILADASFVYGARTTEQQGEALYQFAASSLLTRPVQGCNLSTTQALVLLGWHEICTFQARRGTCYLGYACRAIINLRNTMAQSPNLRMSRINGIDVRTVESELMNNIYWIIYSITLWSFMQFDGPTNDLVPSQLSAEFPPMDASSSALTQLDIVSDNVSTLQAQGRMIRELWQLSHIASTIAHMYALFPRETQTVEAPRLAWQAQPLHQLRQLFSPHQDIPVLCVRIRRILVDAAEVLKAQVATPASQAYVLTAYHTMIIHLLFPRPGTNQADEPISGEALDVMCTSARALIDIVARLDTTPAPNPLKTETPHTALANIITLGLDACGRAIEVLLARLERAPMGEGQGIFFRRGELTFLAVELHRIAKGEKMSSARRLRIVKRKIKENRQRFELSSSGTGTPMTPYDHPAFFPLEDGNLYSPSLPGIRHRGSSLDTESSSFIQNYLSLNPALLTTPEHEKEPLDPMADQSTRLETRSAMMNMPAKEIILMAPATSNTANCGYGVMPSYDDRIHSPIDVHPLSATAGPTSGMSFSSGMECFGHLHEEMGIHPGAFHNA
ncbi:MAG: hypothetical protein M1816_002636 [Peltula sp. TS41687]|nr:MAG: hypothetical protein M1816_002636 [Peltula sp. TS41687]